VVLEPPWSGAAYGYRSRARFALERGGVFGFRRRHSHEVVDLSACPILLPELEAKLPDLKERFARSTDEDREPGEVEVVMAGGALASLEDEPIAAADGLGPLFLAPGVFAQSNPEGNRAMVEYAASMVGAAPRVLELFAGSGNFTRRIAPAVKALVAVEGDPRAIELFDRTKPENVTLRPGPAEELLWAMVNEQERFEVVLAEPQRTGLPGELPEAIAALGASRIVYVSCDLGTFARDVGRFAPLGYTLLRARLFDLYPQTPHAEVIGLLAR
jgi:23S rRNA (uracil1939-C5)-methyltransferase